MQDLAGSLQLWLLLALTRQTAAHNIRLFRFNIPWLVKATDRTTSTEAHALRYLHSTGLDLPIPRLIFSLVHRGTTYTVMSRIDGRNMYSALKNQELSQDTIETIASEVEVVLRKLQTLRQPPADAGKVMLSASGHGLPDPVLFFEEHAGPYPSIIDLWAHCADFFDAAELKRYVDQATLDIMAAEPIRYTHPDLRPYNIFIRDGHLLAIIDWEDSGWYPSSWQVHTMRWMRPGSSGAWTQYWRDKYRFSEVAEAAYAASKTFLQKSPV